MNTAFQRYAITDRQQISGERETVSSAAPRGEWEAGLIRQAVRLAAEGVDYLQLREKDLPAGDLVALGRSLRSVLRGSKTRLLINARVDIAMAAAADGVHLTSSVGELTPRQVHDLFAIANLPAPLVTISCHTLADILRHRLEPVVAILFGPVFEKMLPLSHGSVAVRREGTGLDLLRHACRAAAPVPVFALGGVTAANTMACLEAGARGVAAIRLFNG